MLEPSSSEEESESEVQEEAVSASRGARQSQSAPGASSHHATDGAPNPPHPSLQVPGATNSLPRCDSFLYWSIEELQV